MTLAHPTIKRLLALTTRGTLIAALLLLAFAGPLSLADHKGKPHGKPGGGGEDPPPPPPPANLPTYTVQFLSTLVTWQNSETCQRTQI